MERRECSSFVLSRLDLDDIEEVVSEPFHKDGPGRPSNSFVFADAIFQPTIGS